MNTQATERFLMKRDFAHDTSPGLKTPSYLHSLAPETFDPDYERKAKEVWEAEQASAHTLSQVKTKTTSSACEKSSMKSSRFNHTENHT